MKKALLIHGAYMSSLDFKEMKSFLEKHNVNVSAVELNDGYPEIISYSNYIDNAKHALQEFGECTVIGISMGGMIASELLNEKNLKKAILLSTPVGKAPGNLKYLLLNLKILPQILAGKIRINPKELTYEIENKTYKFLEKIKRFEPISVMKDSGNFLRIFDNIKASKKSIIMAYGDKDCTVNIGEARKLTKVKLKIFEKMSHLLIHEKNRKIVYDYVLENL